MPYYYFDLVMAKSSEIRAPSSRGSARCVRRADQLANELSQVRPELKARGCAVRVTDGDNRELYRTPLDPVRNGYWRERRVSP